MKTSTNTPLWSGFNQRGDCSINNHLLAHD